MVPVGAGAVVALAPVSRAFWADVMQRTVVDGDARLVDVAERLSLVEAALFANRASASAGLLGCYDLSCKAFPEEGGGVATGERLAWALQAHAGCARADQPWCIDVRSCVVAMRPGECGYRLPTRSEWLQMQREGRALFAGVAEWVWPDGVTRLNSEDVVDVAGATVLSSATVPVDRMAPVVAGMKAMHIGFRLARGPLGKDGAAGPRAGKVDTL